MFRTITRTRVATGAATGLTVAALVATGATPASAATSYRTKGNVTKPAACENYGKLPAGGWLANKPCGYVVGTALAGSRFEVNGTSAKGFRYGRSKQNGTSICAWLIPGALDRSSGRHVADSCSTATKSKVFHRRTIGRDFNTPAKPGAAHDRAYTIPVNASACTGYYNYFSDSSYRSGRFRNPVGFRLPANGAYRYTSNDGRAAMIRVGSGENGTTWLFVPRSCINAQLKGHTLYNSND